MTNEELELEGMIRCSFDALARKLGTDVLAGLAKNSPLEFSTWMADLQFKQKPRFAVSFEAAIRPVDEAKTDLVLADDTVSEADEGVH